VSGENDRHSLSSRVRTIDALAPPDYSDPVIDAYKKDVDRTLLRENLKLTVEERFRKHESALQFALELRAAGARHRSQR
jgi:hypothetical protein